MYAGRGSSVAWKRPTTRRSTSHARRHRTPRRTPVRSGPVAIDPDTVLQDALALPADRRAEVAAELLASLHEPGAENGEAIRAAWAEELEHRARRALSGADPGTPWPEVRDRIRGTIAGWRWRSVSRLRPRPSWTPPSTGTRSAGSGWEATSSTRSNEPSSRSRSGHAPAEPPALLGPENGSLSRIDSRRCMQDVCIRAHRGVLTRVGPSADGHECAAQTIWGVTSQHGPNRPRAAYRSKRSGVRFPPGARRHRPHRRR
jgi:hypothetical protein